MRLNNALFSSCAATAKTTAKLQQSSHRSQILLVFPDWPCWNSTGEIQANGRNPRRSARQEMKIERNCVGSFLRKPSRRLSRESDRWVPDARGATEFKAPVCVSGSLRVHHVPGRHTRALHHGAHPEAQHDGVPCGRGPGEHAGAVLPPQPLFLHGDLWPAGSGKSAGLNRLLALFFLSVARQVKPEGSWEPLDVQFRFVDEDRAFRKPKHGHNNNV